MSNKDLSRDGGGGTPSTNIPGPSNNKYNAKLAPSSRHTLSLTSSLIDPVVEESDVIVSSCVKTDSSTMKEAEMGELSTQLYGATAGGGQDREIRIPPELEQSAEIAEDYVKIASRNKRAEHATTYVY